MASLSTAFLHLLPLSRLSCELRPVTTHYDHQHDNGLKQTDEGLHPINDV
eukprot:CAMPEP_0180535508 /NCGR_PEP_ID=MMETSP1036_2-20121128/64771_1 /TAXON_ID=632150 /ORGANISM="Azadinium spinosum, Strain 3D9" /LENGTH=49 /DNA_ID=CAMNT_0022549943 /DNA_START=63 /DNA_END=212 /DNA_ORIENTATION=-